LYCDAVRGQHGTGICAIESDGTYRMFKRALNSSDFLELSTTKKIVNDGDNVFLIGHNRHATYGNHIDDNAHPFVHDNITLFHNGTLTSHSTLNPDRKFNVDSEAISYLFSNSDNIVTDLEKLKGAFALVWYDDVDESLNFARNSDRTFFIATIKGSESLLYASESGMISWLAERNGIVIDEIKPLEAGRWLSIPLDPTRKPKTKTFKPYTPPVTTEWYKGKYTNVKPSPLIDGLSINDVIVVNNISWHNYNTGPQQSPNQKYGYLKCEYKKDITFNVSGISETDSYKYIGKTFTMSVQSITAVNSGYGKLITELSDNDLIQLALKEMEELEDKVITTQPKKEEEPKKIGYTPLTLEEKEVDDDDEDTPPFRLSQALSDYIDENDENLVLGPGNKYIPESSFLKKVHGGCSNCGDDFTPSESDKIVWDYENNPYCRDCASFYNLIEN
jgi:glucosamine 6-phosphate synthetase-like amidotransferase/phosphosugar isomerase protein